MTAEENINKLRPQEIIDLQKTLNIIRNTPQLRNNTTGKWKFEEIRNMQNRGQLPSKLNLNYYIGRSGTQALLEAIKLSNQNKNSGDYMSVKRVSIKPSKPESNIYMSVRPDSPLIKNLSELSQEEVKELLYEGQYTEDSTRQKTNIESARARALEALSNFNRTVQNPNFGQGKSRLNNTNNSNYLTIIS